MNRDTCAVVCKPGLTGAPNPNGNAMKSYVFAVLHFLLMLVAACLIVPTDETSAPVVRAWSQQ